MYTRMGTRRNKPPEPPNPLSAGHTRSAQRLQTAPCQTTFRAALKQRKTDHPFDRISAYKVLESRNNLQHEFKVARSISAYQRARPYNRNGILVACTGEDKAYRLKHIPQNIARELGYNLIPAIEALTLEGVPAADIVGFIQSIKPQVNQLLTDCDAVGASKSNMESICAEALRIAEQAVVFCERHV